MMSPELSRRLGNFVSECSRVIPPEALQSIQSAETLEDLSPLARRLLDQFEAGTPMTNRHVRDLREDELDEFKKRLWQQP